MKGQAVQIEGDKAAGVTLEQLEQFTYDCRDKVKGGAKLARMDGRTTMGGRLWRLTAQFADGPSEFASQSEPRT